MIIDCHTHIGDFNHIKHTPQDLLSSMSDAKIEHSILISSFMSGITVDDVIAVAKEHKNISAIGHLDFDSHVDSAIQKMIGHLAAKEIVGVKLFPGYQDYFPYDERLFPLFEYMQKHGHPLMIHSGVLMVGCNGSLEQSHPLNVGRIAAKFPQLKIVIAHVGNPWLVDTVAVMWQNPNVYADLSGFFTEFEPVDELELHNFLNRMNDVDELINYKRFIFGTDWPLYSQKEYLEAIQRLSFTTEERELVFWKNAKEVFNLDL